MSEWITGRNPVLETLRAGRRQFFRLHIAEGVLEQARLQAILDLCAQRHVPIERVHRKQLDARNPDNQGVALQTSRYPYSDLPEMLTLAETRNEIPLLLILDTLQDPQNLGSLLRTAEAVGVHGILLPLRRTATVTPAVVHASSGASEYLLLAQMNLAQAIESLKSEGIWVVGLQGDPSGKPVDLERGSLPLDQPLALVVGSEGEGMRSLVRTSCDLLFSLPMRGHIESLNAAIAGSVALYLVFQKRGFVGLNGVSSAANQTD